MRLSKAFYSRWAFAIAIVTVGIVSLSLKIFCASNTPPQVPVVTNEPQALAAPTMLQVHGSWDLLWKDERGISVRAHCRIRQTGAVLTLHLSGANLANVDTRTPIEGSVQGGTITFRIQRKDGTPVVFKGTMEDGILYGTTNREFSWMAIPTP